MPLAPTALGSKGIFFLSIVSLAYLAAPYLNLFFLLLGFLGVLATLSVPWTLRNLQGVRAEVLTIGPTPAGQPAPVAIRVRHPRRRRVFGVATTIALAAGRKTERIRTAHVIVTAPGTEETVARGTLPARERGIVPLRGVWLESSYPLGLIRRRLLLEAPPELVVYPAPVALPALRDRGALEAELGVQVGAADRTEPADLRPWRDGDELRQVYWPATARVGAPIVLEREGSGGDGLEVVFDRRIAGEAFEDALSVLSALALRCAEDKVGLDLRTQDGGGRFGDGQRDWSVLLRWLAAAQPLAQDGPPPPSGSPDAFRLPRPGGGSRP